MSVYGISAGTDVRSSTTASAATSTASLAGGGPSVTTVMDDGNPESGLRFLVMHGVMDTGSVLKGVVMFVGMSGGISETGADTLIVATFIVVVTVQ